MIKSKATIFVLIASYRDTECQWTIKDLFEKARYPDRVRIGICWQANPIADKDCFKIETRPGQVRTVQFLPQESKGLGWARQQAQALWQDEDYVLQIDSHMRFVPDWDELMLETLAACASQHPVLTVYPPGYTPPDQLEEHPPVRVQCINKFTTSGILFYTAKTLPHGVEATAPLPTACCAGGFIFGPSRWLQVMAHDPGIYFNGEEHALAARLWTHGFDLFSPHKTLLYHYYQRDKSPKHWSDDPAWHNKHKQTLARLRQLLTPDLVSEKDAIDLGPYGLGNKRSIADYEAWSGVNFASNSIAVFAKTFPYVRTDDAIASIKANKDIQVSDNAVLFIIDDEGFLFSSLHGEIYRMNSAATWVWCNLEEGADWKTLVSGLIELCGMDQTSAENALFNLVAHWHGQGVLVGDEQAGLEADLAPEREQEQLMQEQEEYHLPESFQCYAEQYYRVLDCFFCVQFGEQKHCEWLMPTLVQFEVSSTEHAEHKIVIYQDQEGHSLLCNKKVAHSNVSLSRMGPYLKNEMLNLALEKLDYMLALHAGVIEKNGKVIALPAKSGDGKSTLVAGLINAGYQYYSDEIAPLSRTDCRVTPVPLGICIKETAFPVLQELYPELVNLHLSDRDDGQRAVYMPPPIEAIVSKEEASRIDHIVFPRYEKGAQTQLVPMSKAQAFGRLLDQCISMPKPLTLEDAATLIGWIEQVDCYEMLSGSLESAIEAMDSLVEL